MRRKILWDFEIHMDLLISARRPEEVIVTKNKKKKRTYQIVDLTVRADYRVKLKGSEKKDKYLVRAREQKKTMEHESDADTNRNWCACYNHDRIDNGTRGLENKSTSGDHPNYIIIKINHNTEKSIWDLRFVAVTQIPVS